MKKMIDGDVVFAEILMLRRIDSRAVVLVEGIQDVGILDPHLNESACRTQVAHGKKAVLKAIELARNAGMANVYAVVDRDLDFEESSSEPCAQISISENYDLVADAIVNCSIVTAQVVANFADRDMHQQYVRSRSTTLIELLVAISTPLAILRYLSVKNNYGLNLKNFPIESLVKAYETGALLKEAVRIAIHRSKNSTITENDLYSTASLHPKDGITRLCNGHDLVGALATLMRIRWGGNSVGYDVISRSVGSAVGCHCVQKLAVYRDLANWGADIGLSVWECPDH